MGIAPRHVAQVDVLIETLLKQGNRLLQNPVLAKGAQRLAIQGELHGFRTRRAYGKARRQENQVRPCLLYTSRCV